jgi:hypothetical protein
MKAHGLREPAGTAVGYTPGALTGASVLFPPPGPFGNNPGMIRTNHTGVPCLPSRILLVAALTLLANAGELYQAPPPGTHTRWVSPENPTGAKSQGGRLNQGAKGMAFIVVPPGIHLLLDRTDLPPFDDPRHPQGGCNFYRRDDVSATAYFYLDRPENGLPPLASSEMRVQDLKDHVWGKSKTKP